MENAGPLWQLCKKKEGESSKKVLNFCQVNKTKKKGFAAQTVLC